MCNMSSNYSGKDTHGLMTVHLACYSRNSSAKTVRGSTPRNSHPLMLRQAWNSSVVLRSCARAANFRYRGTQLWMTDNQAGRSRYADGSHRMPQDCRVASLTPKFGTAHSSRCQPHTCVPLHNLMILQILYLNFGKGFKHTTQHRAHKVNSAITLGCANSLVVSVICY